MSALQITWFLLIGVLLTGYAILDGFDLGAGFWHLFSHGDRERRTIIAAIGPVWDGNEVWLLTGGGALFAAFPPVYACVFSGFYLAMMLVLLGLILRAVAIDFRSQVSDPRWRRLWDVAFAVGSCLPALLFGVALGNVVGGLPLDADGNYTGGFWALLNPFALLVGVTGFAMFAYHGARYLVMKTDGELHERAGRWASLSFWPYLGLVIITAVWSLIAHQRGSVLLPVLAVVLAATAIGASFLLGRADRPGRAFLASAVGIAGLMGATGATLFPDLVPAVDDVSRSLTISSASSSQNTLTAMLVIALVGMPLVIGYTVFIYRAFRGKVALDEGGY